MNVEGLNYQISNLYKVIVMKTVCMRHVCQWNRIGTSEIDAHLCGLLVFDKRDKAIQWGRKSVPKQLDVCMAKSKSKPLLCSVPEY